MVEKVLNALLDTEIPSFSQRNKRRKKIRWKKEKKKRKKKECFFKFSVLGLGYCFACSIDVSSTLKFLL